MMHDGNGWSWGGGGMWITAVIGVLVVVLLVVAITRMYTRGKTNK